MTFNDRDLLVQFRAAKQLDDTAWAFGETIGVIAMKHQELLEELQYLDDPELRALAAEANLWIENVDWEEGMKLVERRKFAEARLVAAIDAVAPDTETKCYLQ